MSKGMPTGLTFVEKIFGIILALLGVILTYYTYNNLAVVGITAFFFIAAGFSLIILGFILVIAKAG